MANLRKPVGMKQLALIASYKPTQVLHKKDADGKQTDEISGVFLKVEIDQSTISKKDAQAKKVVLDTNPSLESHKETFTDEATGETNEYISHTVLYSKRQYDSIVAAGQLCEQKDGRIAIGFKGDVQPVTVDKDTKRVIVLCPKDLERAATPEEKAKMETYNKQHPLGAPDHKLTSTSLAKQDAMTSLAKEMRTASLAREAQAETSVTKEAEAELEA